MYVETLYSSSKIKIFVDGEQVLDQSVSNEQDGHDFAVQWSAPYMIEGNTVYINNVLVYPLDPAPAPIPDLGDLLGTDDSTMKYIILAAVILLGVLLMGGRR